MFEITTVWINKTLFPWFDSANATHTVIMGTIGSVIATIIIASSAWFFLRSWGYARHVVVNENRKTRRYLKSLERRARLSTYWQAASIAQRIHFVVLRVTLILCAAVAALACQGFLTLGSFIRIAEEAAPKNTIALINAARQASDGTTVAYLQQQYVFPAILILCFSAIMILIAAVSFVISILKTIRLAEIDDYPKLFHAINAIRKSQNLPLLSSDSPILKKPHSLLYPN